MAGRTLAKRLAAGKSGLLRRKLFSLPGSACSTDLETAALQLCGHLPETVYIAKPVLYSGSRQDAESHRLRARILGQGVVLGALAHDPQEPA